MRWPALILAIQWLLLLPPGLLGSTPSVTEVSPMEALTDHQSMPADTITPEKQAWLLIDLARSEIIAKLAVEHAERAVFIADSLQETGTGLGLVLCREFVEKHGGKLWAASTPGVGSEFIFSMPAHPPE